MQGIRQTHMAQSVVGAYELNTNKCISMIGKVIKTKVRQDNFVDNLICVRVDSL